MDLLFIAHQSPLTRTPCLCATQAKSNNRNKIHRANHLLWTAEVPPERIFLPGFECWAVVRHLLSMHAAATELLIHKYVFLYHNLRSTESSHCIRYAIEAWLNDKSETTSTGSMQSGCCISKMNHLLVYFMNFVNFITCNDLPTPINTISSKQQSYASGADAKPFPLNMTSDFSFFKQPVL